ncbi:MAG TPA: hypothetical protein VLC12_04550 [Terriglobales bacterium]|nr:hypothetical protein [Terriglobales bacterium]
MCGWALTPVQAQGLIFDGPACSSRLRPKRRPAYRWLRIIASYGAAAAAARMRGWDWSVIIFVVSFYAVPALFLFDSIVLNFFPAKEFEAIRGPFQTLGLGPGSSQP